MNTSDYTTIPLTQGKETIVDIIDSDLADLKWHCSKGDKYAGCSNKGNPLYMHRVILERILDRPLMEGEIVDHIDGNGLNNTRSNLRLANNQQNLRNGKLRISNKSGRIGVHYDKRRSKWKAEITLDGKSKHLGRFDRFEDAVEAREEAEKCYFGEFAPRNS